VAVQLVIMVDDRGNLASATARRDDE